MSIQAIGYILLLGFMFGSMSVSSRFLLAQFDPITYTAVRLLMAAAAYLLIYLFKIRGKRWPKDRTLWTRSLIFGVFADAIPILLIISAMQYLSSGLATTLTTIFPVVTVVMAHFLLSDEKLSWGRSVGVLLGMSGALLIVILGETGLDVSGQAGTPGYLMILAASLVIGVSTVFARKYMVQYDTVDTVSIRMYSAAITSSLLALLFEPNGIHNPTSFGLLLLVYGGVIFFSGFLLWFYVLQRYGVMISAISNYIPPIVASVLGFFFLSEKITWGMVAGMALILSGVMVINSVIPKKQAV